MLVIMTVVVLFGAGASQSHGKITPEPPPLGGSLFSDLAVLYPSSWGALDPSLRSLFQRNFEDGMTKVYGEEAYWRGVPRLMQDMASFFLRYGLNTSGESAYVKVCQFIAINCLEGEVLLSTLNYELLLEQAVNRARRKVAYTSFPPPSGEISVLKLHGSVNFLPSARGIGSSLEMPPKFIFQTPIRYVGDLGVVSRFLASEPALYPSMCLYMRGKPTHISPGSIEEIQEFWRGQVKAARKIVLIGVRTDPGDAHLWDAVGASGAEISYVGTRAHVESHFPGRPLVWLGERFEEVVDRVIEVLRFVASV
jgi:hypothetical protein